MNLILENGTATITPALARSLRRLGSQTALPPEFITYWHALVERHLGRSFYAHQHLLFDWAKGESIPGYDTWRHQFFLRWPEKNVPTDCPHGFLPRGWSLANLRRYAPTKMELKLRQSAK